MEAGLQPPMIDFTGQVAWVSGAARKPGMGTAVARILAEHGADVALVDVVVDDPPAADTYEASPDRLDAAVAAGGSTGGPAPPGGGGPPPPPPGPGAGVPPGGGPRGRRP